MEVGAVLEWRPFLEFFFVNRRGSSGYILDGGAKVQFVERKRNDQLMGAASG